MQILGGLIVGLVVVRLLQSVSSAAQTLAVSRERSQKSLQLLDTQIAAAQALRVQNEAQKMHWNGYRKFRVSRKVIEARDVCSFYLEPHDRKPLPQYLPGQFVTFRFHLPDADSGKMKSVVRCYSLSDAPREDYFRITVKRVIDSTPGKEHRGLISNYLHDHIIEGDLLDLQAPRGDFALEPDDSRPVVLIGGGVGVTPVLSMANALIEHGSQSDIWFFYGVRCGEDHAMREHLRNLSQKHENFHLRVCYSCPADRDCDGEDYDYEGHISVDLIRETVKVTNFDFYICGPAPMMDSIVSGLKDWGVPDDQIHMEAFGPATVSKTSKTKTEDSGERKPTSTHVKIQFSRSGKQLEWDDHYETLLDFALEHGIEIDSGCRAGSCGSCEIAVKQGKIECRVEPSAEIREGTCLSCISYPVEDVTLDA